MNFSKTIKLNQPGTPVRTNQVTCAVLRENNYPVCLLNLLCVESESGDDVYADRFQLISLSLPPSLACFALRSKSLLFISVPVLARRPSDKEKRLKIGEVNEIFLKCPSGCLKAD